MTMPAVPGLGAHRVETMRGVANFPAAAKAGATVEDRSGVACR